MRTIFRSRVSCWSFCGLEACLENLTNSYLCFFPFHCFFRRQPEFMVGYGNKNYLGYDKLTEAQLLDRATRQRMLELHHQHAGFPLAEPTLVVKHGTLCVIEGLVEIDGSLVTVVGKADGRDLSVRGVYAAMHLAPDQDAYVRGVYTKVAWTKTPPLLDAAWNVGVGDIDDRPCLFIRSVRRVFLSLATRAVVATSGLDVSFARIHVNIFICIVCNLQPLFIIFHLLFFFFIPLSLSLSLSLSSPSFGVPSVCFRKVKEVYLAHGCLQLERSAKMRLSVF
jgi:hypothetical protein